MSGTTDSPRTAGQEAWNMEMRFWAAEYNWTLIGRSEPHRELEEGSWTIEQFKAAIEGRDPTTLPFPGDENKSD